MNSKHVHIKRNSYTKVLSTVPSANPLHYDSVSNIVAEHRNRDEIKLVHFQCLIIDINYVKSATSHHKFRCIDHLSKLDMIDFFLFGDNHPKLTEKSHYKILSAVLKKNDKLFASSTEFTTLTLVANVMYMLVPKYLHY